MDTTGELFTVLSTMEGLANSQLPPSVAQILPASHADKLASCSYSCRRVVGLHLTTRMAITLANANKPRQNIEMVTPDDYNPERLSILESEIGAKAIEELTFMSGKELPIPQHLN